MKKETILLIVIFSVVGLLVSLIISNSRDRSVSSTQAASPAPTINYQLKIRALKEILAKEPENRKVWVELGHNYYDSDQPMKAIEAYDKALALDGDDPDVLTDQGIMYRRFGWHDKAIDNFNKANSLNPDHPQSLYNLGIVYRDGLQDKEKAKEAWTRYLQVVPVGPGADKVRTMLDHMENGH